MMGWISVAIVRKAIDAATAGADQQNGIRQKLFELVSLNPDTAADPRQMVSDKAFFRLLETVADDCGPGRTIPIQIGASMRCDDYGAFGLAFKSAPDLLGSFARVERFGKVVTSIANFRLSREMGSVFMDVIQGPEQRLGLTMTNELALAALTALCCEVSDTRFAPTAIHLMARQPTDDAVYRAHFRCPIHFETARDALELDAETARRLNRLSDTGMSSFFEAHLEEQLGAIDDDTALHRRILDHIGDTLSEGTPTLATVAGRLGMSSRTLQRRLSDAGLAYQDLVGEARKALSEQLLRRTDYALAEIAFLTGFSDQSTFTRAFKRWHGQTPARYRRGK